MLVAVVMTGCTSSQDSTSDGPDSDPSSPAASASTSLEETPVAEPTPTVPPATGETIKVKGMKVNVPAGWVAGPARAIDATGYPRTDPDSMMTLFRFPQLLVESLDEQARDNATRPAWDIKLKRQDDVTVDGQVVSHLSGRVRPGECADLFSTLPDREQLELEIDLGAGESKAERDEIVQSVLASWKFTG